MSITKSIIRLISGKKPKVDLPPPACIGCKQAKKRLITFRQCHTFCRVCGRTHYKDGGVIASQPAHITPTYPTGPDAA